MQPFIVKLTTAVAICALSTSMAFAGHVVQVTVSCPDISDKGVNDRVVNYGTFLAGTGTLRVNSDCPTNPLFQSNMVPGSDIPLDLKAAGYRNYGVEYNPANGGVVCTYKSKCGHDTFTIGYILKNGLDGVVNRANFEDIHINLPAGLR